MSYIDTPSPWYHVLTVTPACIILIGLVDEFIFRRNVIVALYFTSVTFCLIPFYMYLGLSNVPVFTTIKFYLIGIPVILLLLMRLGNMDNTQFTSKNTFHQNIYQWCRKKFYDPPFQVCLLFMIIQFEFELIPKTASVPQKSSSLKICDPSNYPFHTKQ